MFLSTTLVFPIILGMQFSSNIMKGINFVLIAIKVGFQILGAVSIKMAPYWVLVPCSLEVIDCHHLTDRSCKPL